MLVSVFLHPLRIGWDPALHLQCAELICHGGIPYVDMFDVNPPLIWYLDTIPSYLSTLVQWPQTLTFNICMVLLMVLSGLTTTYVLTKVKATPLQETASLGLVFGLLFFNFHLRYDFGQREEIFVLFYLPYLALRYARYQQVSFGRGTAVLIGLMGALGICLKHYFILVAALVEFSLLAYFAPGKKLKDALKGIVSAENITIVLFAIAYLGHFLLAPREMQDNYFNFLVPAFAKGYFFWDTSLANSLASTDKRNVFFLCAGGCALAFLACRRFTFLIPLAVFSLSSIVPYLMQFKGWAYHDIPVFAGACILLCTLTAMGLHLLLSRLPVTGMDRAMPLLIVLSTAAFSLLNSLEESALVHSARPYDMANLGYKGSSPYDDLDSPFTEYLMKYTRAHDPVLFISNGVSPGYPLMTQFCLRPASRHLHCCILSVLQYIKDCEKPSEEVTRLIGKEKDVIDQYAEDVGKNKPVLIFIQEAPVMDYLNAYDFVKKHMDAYEKIGQAANFLVYKRVNR